MKHKKNEKGFVLVLSLVLLLVMSLMGGALIVISSGDHQSNNSSDEYQQTFYVAETALLEAEKYIINQMMGPWVSGARDTDTRNIPRNTIVPTNTPCYNSFRNIGKAEFRIAVHTINKNFGLLIAPIFADTGELDNLATKEQIKNEQEHMGRFRYEFFVVNIGAAAFKGSGASLKKTTSDVQSSGTAYRVYGCGYMMPKGTSTTEGWTAIDTEDPDILIPLETVLVLSN
jgi:hypothetical protein